MCKIHWLIYFSTPAIKWRAAARFGDEWRHHRATENVSVSSPRPPKGKMILKPVFNLFTTVLHHRYSAAQCHCVITTRAEMKHKPSPSFFCYSSAGINVEVQAKGSLRDCFSARLPSYWRLMNKFVRGTSPLSQPPLPSPLSILWFMDTQQRMSYNFKGLCFFFMKMEFFKCRDEWPLVDYIHDPVVALLHACVCAHICTWVPSLPLQGLKFMFICIYVSFCEHRHIFKFMSAKVLPQQFSPRYCEYMYVSPLGLHVSLNHVLHLTYWMSLWKKSKAKSCPPFSFCLCIWINFILHPQRVWRGVWCLCDGEILAEPWRNVMLLGEFTGP